MNLQEALTFARNMSDAEDASFSTKVTITCTVDISMNNKPDTGVSIWLHFPEFESISLAAPVEASYISAPEVGQVMTSMDVTLNAEEVCKVFGIPDSADWEMSNHGTFLG